MKKFLNYITEFNECIYWILAEPTSPVVEYYLEKIDELKKELQKYVEQQK